MAGKPPPPPPPEESDSDGMEQEDVFHVIKKKKKANSHPATAAGASKGAIPKRSRKQALPKAKPEPAATQLLNNNTYALLPEENGSGDATIVKKERVPPLFTPTRDLLRLQSELSKLSLKPLFKKCSLGTKILCSNLKEYKEVSDILSNYRVPYYTHDIPSTKPLKVVLRGLPAYEAAQVKTELESLGLKPEAVFPMSRRSQANKDDPYRDELFLVHLVKGSTTLGTLRNIKHLFQVIIQWEAYRPQHRDVTQCTKCLWLGHGTRNCRMVARCDKCAAEHLTSACTQADNIEPKCANCGHNHRATSRSCPKRAEFVRIRKQASTANQPGRHRKPPPAATPAQFPPLQQRRAIPVLEPLPLPTTQRERGLPAAPKRSVQPRLALAASQPSQVATPPGLPYAGVTTGPPLGATVTPNDDDSSLSSEEIVEIITAAIEIKRRCHTRSQQLAAIVAIINKYGP